MIFSKKLFPLISGIVITLSVAAAWAAESGSGAASGGFGGAAGSVGGFGSAGGATGGLSGAAGSMSAAAILNSLNTSASPSNSSAGTQFDSAATSARSDKSGRSRDTGNKNQDASKNDLNNQDSLEKDAKKQDALEKDKAQEKDPSLFKNEFQDFVAQSIGKTLPLFGYSLFQNAPSTFSPVEIAPVTPDYIVAPGDELSVRVWGQVEANLNVIVDRNGQINLPNIGSISVAGVAYNKLSEHIGDSISAKFNNFQIDVSMGKLHSIQLFVVGQAVSPGSYSVSSLSTLVNAIVASGGPSAKGSMRHIQLKRGNKVISDFDLYDFLIKGDKSKDVRLLAGDVIYFPPVGAMVAISGSVNTQAIFELKANDKLSDVLNLAGGLTNVAAAQTVSVERIYEHTVRKVDEFQLDKKGLESPMRDGDVVSFNSISPRFDNAVKLQGAVASPMRYVWKEGMRITDLLKDNNSLIPGAYWAVQNSGTIDSRHNKNLVNWDYAVVQRMDKDELSNTLIAFNLGKAIKGDAVENMLIQPGDVVTIFPADAVLPVADNEVVLKAGRFFGSDRHFVWREGMRINDLIPSIEWLSDYIPNLNNGQINTSKRGVNWEYAVVQQTDEDKLVTRLVSFNLAKAIKGDPIDNLLLKQGEIVAIYASDEDVPKSINSVSIKSKAFQAESSLASPNLTVLTAQAMQGSPAAQGSQAKQGAQAMQGSLTMQGTQASQNSPASQNSQAQGTQASQGSPAAQNSQTQGSQAMQGSPTGQGSQTSSSTSSDSTSSSESSSSTLSYRRFVWHEGMRIKDLIPNAKWFIDSLPDSMNDDLYKSINWGYARILRTDINDITRKMLPFSLEKAITGNPADNKVLLAGDEITIYTSNEIKESGEKVVKYVTLEGEVKTPGIYPIEHGETLRQLISRLGGLTPLAHLRSGVFTRESIRQFQQKNLDEALRKFTRELNSAENKTTTSASKNDEAMIQKKIENQHALLDSLRDIKATGRIVLELPEENAQLIDLPDLPLEDGDHFSVSTVPTTVSVVGAVYNQSTFMYRPDRALDDYLEMAGGATNDADAENIYLVLADGTVKSNSSKSFFSGGLRGRRLHAGDLVFMPQKIDVDSFSVIGAVKDVTTIFYQFMLGAAGAKAAKVW